MEMGSNDEPIRAIVDLAAFETSAAVGANARGSVGAEGEELEVRDRGGALELSISLTEAGPMVRIRAARIALESPETISLQCRRFEVDATEAVQLQSGGEVRIGTREMRVRTEADVHLDGAMIRLNCDTPPALPTEVTVRLDRGPEV